MSRPRPIATKRPWNNPRRYSPLQGMPTAVRVQLVSVVAGTIQVAMDQPVVIRGLPSEADWTFYDESGPSDIHPTAVAYAPGTKKNIRFSATNAGDCTLFTMNGISKMIRGRNGAPVINAIGVSTL